MIQVIKEGVTWIAVAIVQERTAIVVVQRLSFICSFMYSEMLEVFSVLISPDG